MTPCNNVPSLDSAREDKLMCITVEANLKKKNCFDITKIHLQSSGSNLIKGHILMFRSRTSYVGLSNMGLINDRFVPR